MTEERTVGVGAGAAGFGGYERGGGAELATEDMVLNIGPQHPATHGVLRLKLTLDGERIVACEPVIGYMHRGVEKLFEVTKIPAAPKTDPADSVHVRLTPRPDTQFAKKFKAIDVWVDTKTEMPKRIRTLDVNETTQRTTDLDVKSINAGLKDADFSLDETGADWNRRSEPYAE